MSIESKPSSSKLKTVVMLLVVALLSIGATLYITKPAKLIHLASNMLQNYYDPSFLPPEQFAPKSAALRENRFISIELPSLSEGVTKGAAQYSQITGDEIHQYLRELEQFSQQSKADGNILWGRIAGSKYEYEATQYVADHFRDWGLSEVTMDRSRVSIPVWDPTTLELTVKGQGGDPDVALNSIMTGRNAALTSAEGITAPLIYVGMGSRAELRGRDIEGKIALLYTRAWKGSMLHSANLPALRLVNEYGAAGVILWMDLPGNEQYATVLYTSGQFSKPSPWASIGFDDGLYLRKRIEHASIDNPPIVNLTVVAELHDDLTSQNLFAQLPGNSDETIMLTAHIDGYFNAALDNGTGVAALMNLAHHYSQIPKEQRRYNLLFVVTGEHEADGMAGMVKFAAKHPELIAKTQLIIQLEHMASPAISADFNQLTVTNTENDRMLMITNVSPWLVENMTRAASDYGITMGKAIFQDYAGDVKALIATKIPTIGWIETGYYYHNSADAAEHISAASLQNMTRAYATIIDKVGEQGMAVVSEDEKEPYAGTFHTDELFKFLFSQW